jgi:VanZ family protein
MLWYLSAVPAEAVHLVEYGILAVLFRRALPGGAGASILAAGLIGILDEVIQGATPGRVFDVRDIVINVLAAAVALWFCDAFRKERAE